MFQLTYFGIPYWSLGKIWDGSVKILKNLVELAWNDPKVKLKIKVVYCWSTTSYSIAISMSISMTMSYILISYSGRSVSITITLSKWLSVRVSLSLW